MASRIERQSSISLGGVTALCAAIGLWVLELGQFTRGATMPMTVVVLLWIAGGGLVLILSRVRLPQAIRMGCILTTLIVLFLPAMSRDIFGGKSTAAKIAEATATDPANALRRDDKDRDPTLSPIGVTVRLSNSPEGDLGWAQQINSALNGRLDGPSWLRIEGDVSARDENGGLLVVIAWHIGSGNSSVRCGTTSIAGQSKAAILDHARDIFAMAIARSAGKGHPACF